MAVFMDFSQLWRAQCAHLYRDRRVTAIVLDLEHSDSAPSGVSTPIAPEEVFGAVAVGAKVFYDRPGW
jgi:hypothetical protein